MRDVMDAWSVCGRSDAIVIGFSLGGAILGEVYEALSPMPAQLVFLNTFVSEKKKHTSSPRNLDSNESTRERDFGTSPIFCNL